MALSDRPTVHHGQITQKQRLVGLTPTIIKLKTIVQGAHKPPPHTHTRTYTETHPTVSLYLSLF